MADQEELLGKLIVASEGIDLKDIPAETLSLAFGIAGKIAIEARDVTMKIVAGKADGMDMLAVSLGGAERIARAIMEQKQ